MWTSKPFALLVVAMLPSSGCVGPPPPVADMAPPAPPPPPPPPPPDQPIAGEPAAETDATCSVTDVRGPFTHFSGRPVGDAGPYDGPPVIALGITCGGEPPPAGTQCFTMRAMSAAVSVCRDRSGVRSCRSNMDPSAKAEWGYDCCVREQAGYQCYWFDRRTGTAFAADAGAVKSVAAPPDGGR